VHPGQLPDIEVQKIEGVAGVACPTGCLAQLDVQVRRRGGKSAFRYARVLRRFLQGTQPVHRSTNGGGQLALSIDGRETVADEVRKQRAAGSGSSRGDEPDALRRRRSDV